jgi:hypothetical protein
MPVSTMALLKCVVRGLISTAAMTPRTALERRSSAENIEVMAFEPRKTNIFSAHPLSWTLGGHDPCYVCHKCVDLVGSTSVD